MKSSSKTLKTKKAQAGLANTKSGKTKGKAKGVAKYK